MVLISADKYLVKYSRVKYWILFKGKKNTLKCKWLIVVLAYRVGLKKLNI